MHLRTYAASSGSKQNWHVSIGHVIQKGKTSYKKWKLTHKGKECNLDISNKSPAPY
jgi:hypothetical protein